MKQLLEVVFCDIHNNKGLCKGYHRMSTMIILDIAKTSSNNCLIVVLDLGTNVQCPENVSHYFHSSTIFFPLQNKGSFFSLVKSNWDSKTSLYNSQK